MIVRPVRRQGGAGRRRLPGLLAGGARLAGPVLVRNGSAGNGPVGIIGYVGHDGDSWLSPLSPLTWDLRDQGYAEDASPEAA
jgi:hypothetical protein